MHRASGEGVGPQEYTLIKMQVLELRGALAQLEGKHDMAALGVCVSWMDMDTKLLKCS